MPTGTLYLIPVPLADHTAHKTYTPFLKESIHRLDTYIVENEKTARKFLKEAEIGIPQPDLQLYSYGKHERSQNLNHYFKDLLAGKDVGLMSEAGCPGIADPGADIVAEAHKRNIKVVPLSGPSSIFLALMSSGFNGQQFSFQGYLPKDTLARIKKIKELETQALKHKHTQIFIETPFRNEALFSDLLKTCKDYTLLCVACDISAEGEFIKTQSIAAWRKQKIDLHKKPCIFILGS